MNDEKVNHTSFATHLIELRSRLVKSIVYLFIFFIICYFFAENIYSFLVEPYAEAVKDDEVNRRLIFTALHETFITYLKVAFFAAMFVTSPIILTQIWKFVAPGLYKNEKKALLPYLIATPTLFLLGGMLVYYLVMPLAIRFFLSFETPAQINSLPIQLEAKVNEYLSLIMSLIFAFGISFQLPVLLSLLARVGFVDSEYLKKRRKYVIIIIFYYGGNINTAGSNNTNWFGNTFVNSLRIIYIVSQDYRKEEKRCIILNRLEKNPIFF